MKVVIQLMLVFLLLVNLLSCAQSPSTNEKEVNWDFDHQVQYEKIQLAENQYHLVIRSNGKTPFAKLATFLLRKSYQLCGHYGFNLETLEGIEGYNDRLAFPHLLMGSLAANLTCTEIKS